MDKKRLTNYLIKRVQKRI